MEITLEQMLAARDHRHAMQQQLLARYPDHTLVCATVVMPGSVKRNADSVVVTHELERFIAGFDGREVGVNDAPTGYEAYVVTTLSPLDAKRVTCQLEDKHPLGRLMDIDVLDHEGVPVSRQAVGVEPRRCLLCDHEARWCMRNHTHTTQELLAHIHDMVERFKNDTQTTSNV